MVCVHVGVGRLRERKKLFCVMVGAVIDTGGIEILGIEIGARETPVNSAARA
jgi:hypothetical protein